MRPFNRQSLKELIQKKERVVIGLNSGTSADGIDASLLRISGTGFNKKVENLASHFFPFSPAIRGQILKLAEPSAKNLESLLRCSQALGFYFAGVAKRMILFAQRKNWNVDLIGSHGQTICYYPDKKIIWQKVTRVTWQIGEPEVIAKRTGVITVGDFRNGDLAASGQGAPLSPLAHFLLMGNRNKSRGIVNIGGIANLTILPRGRRMAAVWGFDTGPGNMLSDMLMFRLSRKQQDYQGKIALQGKVARQLLTSLQQHTYFSKKPPKTTGREEFGEKIVAQILRTAKQFKINRTDLITTVAELTVWSIFDSYRRYVHPYVPCDELFVSGGGVHNQYFIDRLQRLFNPLPVRSVAALGINPDHLEAMLFAILADLCIDGIELPLQKITGAKKPVVLGKICQP